MKLFHPTYFSSVLQFAYMLQSDGVVFEIFDNFQKQTYRNRCYIYGANGKQLLNVPVQKVSGKQLTKDIKIDYSSKWQSEHLKSLLSAYRSSPFFEFYIDELLPIFKEKETFLVDLNIKTTKILFEALQEKLVLELTSHYKKEEKNDYRFLVNAKEKPLFDFQKYMQVFDDKHGFISNLSILDLLFMEGPLTTIYLNKLLGKSDFKKEIY
jgi:hypothetical protein